MRVGKSVMVIAGEKNGEAARCRARRMSFTRARAFTLFASPARTRHRHHALHHYVTHHITMSVTIARESVKDWRLDVTPSWCSA